MYNPSRPWASITLDDTEDDDRPGAFDTFGEDTIINVDDDASSVVVVGNVVVDELVVVDKLVGVGGVRIGRTTLVVSDG